jgi:hypothetical protein
VGFIQGGVVKRGADEAYDLDNVVRLGNERPGSGIVRRYPTRSHEELEVWEISQHSLGKLKTVHRAGQLDVRKNKVYRVSGTKMLHGFISVGRLNHPHARVAQFLRDCKPDQEFVLHHEHGANLMLGRSARVTYHRAAPHDSCR